MICKPDRNSFLTITLMIKLSNKITGLVYVKRKRPVANQSFRILKVLLKWSLFQIQLNLQLFKLFGINAGRRIQHHIPATVIFWKGDKIPDTFTTAEDGA